MSSKVSKKSVKKFKPTGESLTQRLLRLDARAKSLGIVGKALNELWELMYDLESDYNEQSGAEYEGHELLPLTSKALDCLNNIFEEMEADFDEDE